MISQLHISISIKHKSAYEIKRRDFWLSKGTAGLILTCTLLCHPHKVFSFISLHHYTLPSELKIASLTLCLIWITQPSHTYKGGPPTSTSTSPLTLPDLCMETTQVLSLYTIRDYSYLHPPSYMLVNRLCVSHPPSFVPDVNNSLTIHRLLSLLVFKLCPSKSQSLNIRAISSSPLRATFGLGKCRWTYLSGCNYPVRLCLTMGREQWVRGRWYGALPRVWQP